MELDNLYLHLIWDKVFMNEPSKICRRQPLKTLKRYGLFKCFKGLPSTNFTWSIF